MVAQIISIANHNGGVGKTTVSINLSYSLYRKDKKVLVIDFDGQAHTTQVLFNKNMEVCKTGRHVSPRALIWENTACLLFDKKKSIEQIIYTPSRKRNVRSYHLIPSCRSLSRKAEEHFYEVRNHQILINHLKPIMEDYDYIIIDCPLSSGVLTKNALYAADLIVTPCIYDTFSLSGLSDLFRSIKELKTGHNFSHKILLNNCDPRKKTMIKFLIKELENYLEDYKERVLNTKIRTSESINIAHSKGVPVHLHNENCSGTEDFNLLAKEIIEGDQ